eukprot:CAMPEP_0113697572 /NCGR_PEP_ID=MMETSP0038_2-20120614/22210_1 /TAXON_ID=2898 /ORGANISM="Cryptomonas paramecium" /LENGTH=68 /DNA_ID=CAMNT_0000620601 /DNA_START=1653 /DNA_END=1859 /DNA_ORIENTATION=+ /assembly_acc=CAM_ASM_000170
MTHLILNNNSLGRGGGEGVEALVPALQAMPALLLLELSGSGAFSAAIKASIAAAAAPAAKIFWPEGKT